MKPQPIPVLTCPHCDGQKIEPGQGAAEDNDNDLAPCARCNGRGYLTVDDVGGVMDILGIDTETHLISQENQAPRIVCLSMAKPMPGTVGPDYCDTDLIGNDDWAGLEQVCTAIVDDETLLKVGTNIAYDLSVFAANFPQLLPLIFLGLERGTYSCIIIREKLITLAETGDLEFLTMPDGSKTKRKWGLQALAKYYLGLDLAEEKNASDAWRTNFAIFDGVPAAQYPEGARKYAIEDSVLAVTIHAMQEERRQKMIRERGIDPLKVEGFRVTVDFCLKLMAAWGAKTDVAEIEKVKAELDKELTPDKLNLLIEKAILRPGEPPRPHKNAREHVPDCPGKGCSCPPRMTQGKPESVDLKNLKAYVLNFAKARNGFCKTCHAETPSPAVAECKVCRGTGVELSGPIKVKYTDKDNLSVDADFLKEFSHMDPVLAQYKHRQDLQKLVTTELPRMMLRGVPANVVHPQYDVLKETGRTSSFSSKSEEYASFNVQNVHPKVRRCFVPREGHLLFSVDFSQMELGTLAQTCLNLFRKSVLAEKINAGVDVHMFTGAQLAFAMESTFATECAANGAADRDRIADLFLKFKKGNDEQQKFFKHYRKFAKPVNLGYPGGLGPATMVAFAKTPYDVIIDEETARMFRDLWKDTYPEMKEYFNYINKECIDQFNRGWDADEKQEYALYSYTSPLGMHRAGCDYCACANGLGLQTPSAEGALIALGDIVRSCYDYTQDGILSPDARGAVVRPWGFIHDEFVGEVREDQYVHERMMEIKRIMVESMRVITPDVTPNANPALMRRWDKAAEPVYDDHGRLAIWTPQRD